MSLSQWLDANRRMHRHELYEWCATNGEMANFESLWDDMMDGYMSWCEDTETVPDLDE